MASNGPAAEEHAWWAYKYMRGTALTDTPTEVAFRAGFAKGAQWMFITSGKLAPYLDDFVRLLEYMADHSDLAITIAQEEEAR